MATEKISKFYSFISGFVQDRNTLRFIAQIDELNESDEPNSTLMKWVRDDDQRFHFELDWYATRLWAFTDPEVLVFAVGPDGRVLVSTTQVANEERIAPDEDGPEEQGVLRGMRYVGRHLYVVGMGRQVYRREESDNWVRRDSGVLQPLDTENVTGFNAIDGASDDHLFAVGFGGEIWRYAGSWQKIDSPTNLILNDVHVVDDNLVFACGQSGTLLRGDGERWVAIAQNETEEDLWSMEFYRGKLYIASDSALFRLNSDDTLELIDMGLGSVTCGHLHSNDGVLLSVGVKHVCWSEDATTWFDLAN